MLIIMLLMDVIKYSLIAPPIRRHSELLLKTRSAVCLSLHRLLQ